MENNYLDLLIELIINNTRLSYDEKDLRIDEDKAVMEVIKIIAKEKYKVRFNELTNK